jgi:Nuclease-related domain
MARSRPWPFDDEDRPSGSVRPLSQADLQAILAHLGEDPDQLLAGTGADRPMVAVPVWATVGRPGGSAQARWRRMRADEWATWTRTLPWRVGATLGIGGRRWPPCQPAGTSARAGRQRARCPGGRLGAAVQAQPGRGRLAAGSGGERRTARLLAALERHGWVVLHDLALPGSRANLDHLVIGPGGYS